MLKVIIVDDEPFSVQTLEELVKRSGIPAEILGSAHSVPAAFTLIKKFQHELNVIFLDVQMPNQDGFALLQQLENINFKIVFTTAYDNYAIKAIKFSAFDYLLKPIDFVELQSTLSKILAEVGKNPSNGIMQELIKNAINSAASNKLFKLAVPTINELIFLEPNNILYIESENSYSFIHLSNGKKITSSKSIGYYEELLSEKSFFRIHNSFVINLDKVTRYIRGKSSRIEIANSFVLEVSVRRRDDLLKKLQWQ